MSHKNSFELYHVLVCEWGEIMVDLSVYLESKKKKSLNEMQFVKGTNNAWKNRRVFVPHMPYGCSTFLFIFL